MRLRLCVLDSGGAAPVSDHGRGNQTRFAGSHRIRCHRGHNRGRDPNAQELPAAIAGFFPMGLELLEEIVGALLQVKFGENIDAGYRQARHTESTSATANGGR